MAGRVVAAEDVRGVLQTDFSPGSGNALQACVASMVGVAGPLDASGAGGGAVPNFIVDPRGYDAALGAWAEARGLRWAKVTLDAAGALPAGSLPAGVPRDALCVLRGKSPRGDHAHVVVAQLREGKPAALFDPHPDGTMLDGPGSWAGFLCPLPPRERVGE